MKFLQIILAIIFSVFLMFDQIFLCPQVLPQELLNDLGLRISGNKEIGKSQNVTEL